MMERVVSAHFPYLPIRLAIRGQTIALEAFLDTGFDGDIVIPPGLVPSGAAPDHYLLWILADGSPVQAPAYLGAVQVGPLGAFPVAVTVLGGEPIVGRRLTDRFRVILDHGRQLVVER
jgi:predicted aspartyl protease